jgi:hypothetical protein
LLSALLSCLLTAEHPAVRVRGGRASYRVLKPTFAELWPHVLSSYTQEPLQSIRVFSMPLSQIFFPLHLRNLRFFLFDFSKKDS